MNTKKIFREPIGNQDRFLIVMVNKKKKNLRRFLELCKEMHCNLVNFENTSATEEYDSAIACEEVALMGIFKKEKLVNQFRHAAHREEIMESSKVEGISIEKEVTPTELRWKVFSALMRGKLGIEYSDIEYRCIDKDCGRGSYFRYVQDMNYRIKELGRTLMALNSQRVYNRAVDASSQVLAEQSLPPECAIGEFVDSEGNSYLMIQNKDYTGKDKKAFQLKLNKAFRVYRVNPHNGKQILVKDSVEVFNVLAMPGDADLLRFQDAEEEAYFIEYIFRK